VFPGQNCAVGSGYGRFGYGVDDDDAVVYGADGGSGAGTLASVLQTVGVPDYHSSYYVAPGALARTLCMN